MSGSGTSRARPGDADGWQGIRRADGTWKKGEWRKLLCPALKEYCKGPKCALWLPDTELCAITQAAGALHFLAVRDRGREMSEVVAKLADKIGGLDA